MRQVGKNWRIFKLSSRNVSLGIPKRWKLRLIGRELLGSAARAFPGHELSGMDYGHGTMVNLTCSLLWFCPVWLINPISLSISVLMSETLSAIFISSSKITFTKKVCTYISMAINEDRFDATPVCLCGYSGRAKSWNIIQGEYKKIMQPLYLRQYLHPLPFFTRCYQCSTYWWKMLWEMRGIYPAEMIYLLLSRVYEIVHRP